MLGLPSLLLLWGLAAPCHGLLETVGTLARIDKDELGKGELAGGPGRALRALRAEGSGPGPRCSGALQGPPGCLQAAVGGHQLGWGRKPWGLPGAGWQPLPRIPGKETSSAFGAQRPVVTVSGREQKGAEGAFRGTPGLSQFPRTVTPPRPAAQSRAWVPSGGCREHQGGFLHGDQAPVATAACPVVLPTSRCCRAAQDREPEPR